MTEKRRERKPVSQAIVSTAKVMRLSEPTYFVSALLPAAPPPLLDL